MIRGLLCQELCTKITQERVSTRRRFVLIAAYASSATNGLKVVNNSNQTGEKSLPTDTGQVLPSSSYYGFYLLPVVYEIIEDIVSQCVGVIFGAHVLNLI